MAKSFISQVCDAKKQVDSILGGMDRFVNGIKGLPTRKDQALKITSAYSTTNRAGFVFQLLDGRTLDKDAIKKLYWQCLKK